MAMQMPDLMQGMQGGAPGGAGAPPMGAPPGAGAPDPMALMAMLGAGKKKRGGPRRRGALRGKRRRSKASGKRARKRR